PRWTARPRVRRPRRPARRPGAQGTDIPPIRCRTPYPVRAMITAIYPGTYDPVTNGHVDVIDRAARIFDRVVVGVVNNPHHKTPLFVVPERVDFLNEALAGVENVEVDVFSELVVDFARRWDA